jgi:hemerythrin superfamily protein
VNPRAPLRSQPRPRSDRRSRGGADVATLRRKELSPMKNDKKMDATALLKQDHETVAKLFKEYSAVAKADDDAAKESVVAEISAALEVHAAVEEEIFYPAVKQARAEKTKDAVREGYEEHKEIKALVAALESISPDDESYDAKVKVLKEDVEHHVEEEEGEMFPDARKFLGKEGLEELGEQIAERKAELESPSSRSSAKKPASSKSSSGRPHSSAK